jgi:hypothetical protein
MTSNLFTIRSPRLLTSGAGGGRAYAKGLCDFGGNEVAVCVFPSDKTEEAKLQIPWKTLTVACARHDFVVGVGLSLWDCRILESS